MKVWINKYCTEMQCKDGMWRSEPESQDVMVHILTNEELEVIEKKAFEAGRLIHTMPSHKANLEFLYESFEEWKSKPPKPPKPL